MVAFVYLTGILERLGIPGCVVLVLALSAVGFIAAEERYVKSSEFVQVAKNQIAASIRETHDGWCNSKSEKSKEYWWTQLQSYQDEYRRVTNNGQYQLPPCQES